jgi:DNA-directed RNA polymerase subunit RPC12/RpoP
MEHTRCPKCGAGLRIPHGHRKLICPTCQHRFRVPRPIESVRQFRLPLTWRVEGASALIGLVSLAALVAMQVFVLLPLGRTYPGERVIRLPEVASEDTLVPAEPLQPRPYNEVLFWGSAISYCGVAAAEWFAFRRWKTTRVRSDRRRGIHGSGSSAWRQWGGGTATAIVLVGGLALAVRYKDVLWTF